METEFLTQGYARLDEDEGVFFSPEICQCGSITDGVALRLSGQGAWVISYDSLMEMARLATEEREPKRQVG